MRGLSIPLALVRVVCRLARHQPCTASLHRRHLASSASDATHSFARSPPNPLANLFARQIAAPKPPPNLPAPDPTPPPSPAPGPPPPANRYHSVSWRFQSHAQSHSLPAALAMLETEGAALYRHRQAEAAAAHQRTAALHRQQDEAIRQQGKTAPPRASSPAPDPNTPGTAMDWLACHPPSVYLELMRTFASYGDVDGCYALLTRLYQLAMHTEGLIAFPSKPTRAPAPRPTRLPSMRQQLKDSTQQQAAAAERKRQEAQRSPFTPTSDHLGAIMTAYSTCPTSYLVAHHHQLFTHYSTLKLSPTPELYYSLLLYHAHRHSVHTYITAMSILARSRDPPGLDEYIRAIRYFGLNCRDAEAALVLFLHLTSLALPNATAFNSLIAVYAEKGDWMMAYRLMTDMEKQGQRTSAWTWASLIRALLVDGKEKVAVELHDWARQWKKKEVESRQERWSDNCYAVLMAHYTQHSALDRVQAVWRQMKSDRVRPERDTFVVVLRALQQAGELSTARAIVEDMTHTRGFVWDALAYDTALQVVAAQGDLAAMQRLYGDMKEFMDRKRLTLPQHVYATVVSAFPSSLPPATESAAGPSPQSLCLDLLSVLRDQQRRGAVPTSSLIRKMLELLAAYGATDAAQLLKTSWWQRREQWSPEALRGVEAAVVEQLRRGGGGAESMKAELLQQPPPTSDATAELRA